MMTTEQDRARKRIKALRHRLAGERNQAERDLIVAEIERLGVIMNPPPTMPTGGSMMDAVIAHRRARLS